MNFRDVWYNSPAQPSHGSPEALFARRTHFNPQLNAHPRWLMDRPGEVAAWVAAGMLLYAYGLYPLMVLALAKLRPRPIFRQEWRPRISFIITAHNEAKGIAAKIENTLALDYPAQDLEILVSSDCSTDGTDGIVQGYGSRGVRLTASTRRVGKTLATQRAVREAAGDLLVFSDATGSYSRDALQRLASAAADPCVGCVCGRVEYESRTSLVALGQQIYWWFEKLLRRAESSVSTLPVISGSIHAVRREGFPFAEGRQNYDLLLPLLMANRRLRTVFEERAISLETPSLRAQDEFRARVRAGIQAFSYLEELRRLKWVRHYPFFTWSVISHKVLRWFTPLWLTLLLLGHAMLATRGGVWLWTLFPHFGIYLLAALGAALPVGPCTRWLAAPVFLGTACAGFFVGLVRYLQGERAATWDSAR